MFSFTDRKKKLDVQAYLRRIVDLTSPNTTAPSADGRADNRCNRTIPTLLCPWTGGEPNTNECVIVLTKDISSDGIGLVASQPFQWNEVLVGFYLSNDVMSEPWYFTGEIRRAQRLGGGFWTSGVELTAFVSREHAEALTPLKTIIAKLRVPETADV